MKKTNLVFIFALVFLGCATQVPPSGGPPDTTPPQIIKTYPENRTTNFKDDYVEVEFSEYVDKRSVQDAIYISPYVEGEIKFKWSGRKLKLIFPEKLKENKTYVITFGTEIRDLNAGNKMKESFALAFSTGSKIDSGSIGGKIYASKENFMVFAYLIDGINPDTLSPLRTKPDYVTQAGKDGNFKLQFLKLGKYRLIAINDKLRNLLYNPNEDEYGVFWKDVEIDSLTPSVENIIFKTTIEDTSKPFVSSVNVIDASHILVKFSEKIILSEKSFKLENSAGSLNLVPQIYPDSTRVILIIFDKLLNTGKYKLFISKVSDLAGNEIEPQIFELSPEPRNEFPQDTTAPSLIFSTPSDDETEIDLSANIKLLFDDILNPGVGASLVDSSGAGTEIKIEQNLNSLEIKPVESLKANELYTLNVFNIRDVNGNVFKDTLKITFRTLDPANFGAIEGNVVCDDTVSSVVVSAFEVGKKKIFQTKTKCNSRFIFEKIPQGRYLIEAFIDSNGNGKYDYGKVYPFIPSERFSVFPDTVKVRARWTTENINVKF
ncbi:Ig-like domain-containing protein [Candidatus Chrysopegis kryptomonas]|uniref:Copper-binding protein CopC (Methionine-rich) n=1 Tax=Candidatus Chryseopegocella kryptomonas TaxID=1633643 RepID=A0A0P1MRC6_9BACT|nr:Ig-like domain-containing protein [Candidatus Chrysopegis kryptomonas]CUS98272.1 Copper-binding protein CopC (methionine-rich) [Candidatus Chrysopegis kryptomonas]